QITDIYTRITLRVESSPQAVGLTSAVAQALSARSIPCNVIAGFYHDHIFVPKRMTDDAIELLRDLSKQAQGWL
ncbi:ACT domain-containing protein, partial [Streptococcus agalactiae]